jgi:hypothetical protein
LEESILHFVSTLSIRPLAPPLPPPLPPLTPPNTHSVETVLAKLND